MLATVFHLEKFPLFLRRAIELNGLHAPDDPVRDALLDGEAARDPDAARVRQVLHAIHRNFPNQAPLPEQAAYLVRAFAGLRPFAEANHRTGWDVMAETLHHAGHEVLATPAEVGELGNILWDRLDGMEAAELDAQDETTEFLVSWFHSRIA